MPNVFALLGLIGTDLPLSFLSALLLLVIYRGFRSERFLVWWIFYDLFQTISLASLLFFVLRPTTLFEPSLLSRAGSLLILGIGVMGPPMLVCGFRDAIGKPVTTTELRIGSTMLGLILLLTSLAAMPKSGHPPQASVLPVQVLAELAFLYVAVSGFPNRKTRILAAGCALSLLTTGLRIAGILVAAFGHHFIGAIQSTPTVYATILLLQSASSGLITLGMIWLVTEMHRALVARLGDAMGELRRSNDQLERVAGIDPLTEIANRRSFDRGLATRWRQALRSGVDIVCLLMIDVDHFKTLNDTMGHPAGDLYLKQLALILQKIFRREEDLVARIGGEEFAVLLTGLEPDSALQLAERARAVVEENLGKLCTVSIGCASAKPSTDSEPEALIQTADKALYLAKESGRNKVVSLPTSALKTAQSTDWLAQCANDPTIEA